MKLQKICLAASVLMIAATSVYIVPVNVVAQPSTPVKPVPKPTNSPKPVPKPLPPIKANPVFQAVVPQIRKVTKIPVLLPKEIPTSEGESQLYATVQGATAQKYQVILGYVPDCNGGTACRYGEVSGEAVRNQTPRLTGKAIFLRKGVTGYFSPSRCGANCSDAIVMWRQKGIQYSVGIKAAQQVDLVKVANSFVVP
ncbi:hypothetical protein [Calothrix sp. PCC 6303]|uniref:hypothetical protein n=1 Tax=Calothrix sp. PCC 6303 TaxID=1170562 RepID=UPI0002A047B1|nr:hypothetical protein [Calothrix sp. PCC 6303]AFY99134.1 hypothetical protein Cal6303_0023 [Calothrix sp. PCC 6303]